jgi:hypothetical protein
MIVVSSKSFILMYPFGKMIATFKFACSSSLAWSPTEAPTGSASSSSSAGASPSPAGVLAWSLNLSYFDGLIMIIPLLGCVSSTRKEFPWNKAVGECTAQYGTRGKIVIYNIPKGLERRSNGRRGGGVTPEKNVQEPRI